MAKIHLIELPAFKLLDEEGLNWTAFRHHEPLASKQILTAQLLANGFDVEIVNLKAGDTSQELGEVSWKGRKLRKIVVGDPWQTLIPQPGDIWGVTVNYLQERQVACEIIRHLASHGGTVVVGGSDAFAEPAPYLNAGATVVMHDKSGAANVPILNHLLGQESSVPLAGVTFPDEVMVPAGHPMSPNDWPLPPDWVVAQTLGIDYWEAPLPESLLPIGAVMLDMGCDRHCNFCQTPTYGLGYRYMSPERALAWLAAQKAAGAKSVIIVSDQFLGRVLWKNGRAEIIEIMKGLRDLGLAALWGNGLELKKATIGRSLPLGDTTPDEELIQAVWGWDKEKRVGCAQAYIPAERPLAGDQEYKKLLPWKEHCQMMEAIVRAGVPDITYGVIVGLPDDSNESLNALHHAVAELRARLKTINPDLKFRVTPYAVRPLPGTESTAELKKLGLIKFSDPGILGGFWTACADTSFLSYQEVSDWQRRLIVELSDLEPGWQGITATL